MNRGEALQQQRAAVSLVLRSVLSSALCQQSGPIWMLSVRTLFGIGFLVTSRVGAVLAHTGTCPLSTAANLRRKDCLGSRSASTMAKTIKYLG